MSFSNGTPRKGRPPAGQQGSLSFNAGSTPATKKFRSSLVPMARPSPARSFPAPTPTKLSASSAGSRDLFQTTTSKPSRVTQFAPSLPAAALQPSPGARKYVTAKSASAGMAATSSSDLFKMRIPEPDTGLSGEVLSKAVPKELDQKGGTVYADQFLADKCPPEFDDLQRRQFFCILDLRRLKYTANEIFASKDWKLNIVNFAKEYEKSRGLIMLRYGLYEFKNVKPSAEVMRKWRAAHGLPDPDPEPSSKPPTTTASTKRKAEDDLQSKDNTLMTSANQNKRRNVEQEPTDGVPKFAPSPMKSKRKADETEEPDENQRGKVQKATPSAAKSKLESILNRVQSGTSTPAGSPLKRPAFGAASVGSTTAAPPSLFGVPKKADETEGSAFATKSNPFVPSTNGVASPAPKLQSSQFQPGNVLNGANTGSVLSGHKIGSTPVADSPNIFGYLSSSASSSVHENNADADAESDAESEHETEPEMASQDAAPSYEPSAAASTGTATPPIQGGSSLFNFKPTNASASFPAPTNKSSDSASKGGLFGRVSFGADGQPLRATPTENSTVSLSPIKDDASPETESTKTPAKTPGDFTFNPETTPISFASQSAAATSPEKAKDPEKAPTSNASSIFAKASVSASASTPQPSAPPLFGSQKSFEGKTESAPVANSIFANQKPASGTSFSFGAPAGKPVTEGLESSTAKDQPNKPLFGGSMNGEVKPATTPLFGGFKKSAEPEKAENNGVPSIFGAKPADTTASTKRGFGDSEGQPAKKPMFGTISQGKDSSTSSIKRGFGDSEGQPAKKPMFGSASQDKDSGSQPATTPLFGAPKSDQPPVFGSGPSTLFGSSASKPNAAAPASTIFGNSAPPKTGFQFGTPAPTEKKAEEPAAAKTSIFSSTASGGGATGGFSFTSQSNASAPKENPSTPAPIFSFGGGQNNAPAAKENPPVATPIFGFGGQNNTPAASSTSAVFNFGGSQNAPPVMFGGSTPQVNGSGSGKIDMNFTGSTNPPSTSFSFGAGNQDASNQSFTFTAGGANPFSPSKAAETPKFGGGSANTTPAGSFNFQFGGQGSSAPNAGPAVQDSPMFGGQANGTSARPSFSFTSASPAQSTASAAKPAGMFGLLQPGGGSSTGASSPFPAPSSMNTTPVNGTPEPQTQGEDGEEAPQQQISLTDGGPGEEDETILHEVRAKAVKYVPIVDDEDAKSSSPWATQGVGPLRVLKNNTTGTVRILLRAEPRGHIAMNKTILSDIEYKPNGKTIKMMAASDDGSALETWVLQVKTPEFAIALAGALEANKGANKKK